jgi:GMP synthase (glutamine-hydrolysing)
MKKRAVAIRHVGFEDLGTLEPWLVREGHEVEVLDAGKDDLSLVESRPCDLLVVLGGPISVNDRETFAFIDQEQEIIRKRLLEDEPTLGICLGAQLMASALGSRVFPGEAIEIGWAPVQLTRAGQLHPLRHLDAETPTFHWHGETFDLPAGAHLLGSTPICPNQAFSYGERGLALQFHPEVTGASLERWYIGHAVELAHAQIAVSELRRQAAAYSEKHAARAALFFAEWLASLRR